jgi:hypothetical protein
MTSTPARPTRAWKATYRDREKLAQAEVKADLFTPDAAGTDGLYGEPDDDRRYPWCLREDRSEENLHESIREEALAYFGLRSIPWHDGLTDDPSGKGRAKPSNHLCCSQSQCVNVLFPFRRDPDALARLLRHLGLPVARMLPVTDDCGESDGFVGFEWIGARNYLGEHRHGRVAPDDKRARGRGFTSADFVVRFQREDGGIEVRLGEWNYTEEFRRKGSTEWSWADVTDEDGEVRRERRTNRVDIYRPAILAAGLAADRPPEDLFFDPFDRMMRLQLLAYAMERARELDADRVGSLHAAPAANAELMRSVTSPNLADLGATIHEVWARIAPEGRFLPVASEALIDAATTSAMPAGAEAWAAWVRARYVR